MPTLTKSVSPTLEPVSDTDETIELVENETFELFEGEAYSSDVLIKMLPMGGPGSPGGKP